MRVGPARAFTVVVVGLTLVAFCLASCADHQPDQSSSGHWVRYSVGLFSIAHPPDWIARRYRAEFNGPEGDGQVLMGTQPFSSPCVTTGNERVCKPWPHVAHLGDGGVAMAWLGGTTPQVNRFGRPINLSLSMPIKGLSRPASYTVRRADVDCAHMGGTQQMSVVIGARTRTQQIASMNACVRNLTPALRAQVLAIVKSVKLRRDRYAA